MQGECFRGGAPCLDQSSSVSLMGATRHELGEVGVGSTTPVGINMATPYSSLNNAEVNHARLRDAVICKKHTAGVRRITGGTSVMATRCSCKKSVTQVRPNNGGGLRFSSFRQGAGSGRGTETQMDTEHLLLTAGSSKRIGGDTSDSYMTCLPISTSITCVVTGPVFASIIWSLSLDKSTYCEEPDSRQLTPVKPIAHKDTLMKDPISFETKAALVVVASVGLTTGSGPCGKPGEPTTGTSFDLGAA